MPTEQPKYFRFEMLKQNSITGSPDGLFVAAHDQLRNPELPGYHGEKLSELIDWFRKNLKRPDRFNSSSSKGHYRRNSKGISWYKDTAQEHIAKMREIAAILHDQGLGVSERSTVRPGYIVYEDEFQVVAEPFREEF